MGKTDAESGKESYGFIEGIKMKNFILTRFLKWIGRRMEGYKTYAGATGKTLAGVGTLISGIIGMIGIVFPDQGLPKMELEPALGLISAGVYAISSGLSSYGMGKKIEKSTGK